MALSIVSIPGDGVTDTFTVSFALGVLDQTQVTAWVTGEVDGLGAKIYRTITFLTDTLLKISGPKAGNGVMVVFTRTVPNSQLIVNYEDGDIMNETNLNTAQKQVMMLVHQVLDGRFSAFIQNVSAGGFKMTDLGVPTAGTDAANKAYVDSLITTGSANAIIAANAASAAAGSASAASGSAGTASTQAGLASGYAGDALTYRNNAQTYAAAALASQNKAQEWSDKAEDTFVTGTTEYSAYHWYKKAQAVSTGGMSTAIHGSTSKGTLVDADEFAALDSATSFSVIRVTWLNLKANVLAYFNAAAKATPIDADRLWVGDSTAANIPKFTTFTQIKAFLKTYNDTLYAVTGHTHAAATTTVDGFMSAADKVKLNAVGTMANRAVTVSTSAPTGGVDGDAWWQV